MKFLSFLFLFFSFSFSLAQAEEPPITDWSQVEVVVVRAKAEGPAFWHVTKGNAEVWILGTLNPAYEGMFWDERRLKVLLRGSKLVVLQPEPDIGFFSAVWFAITYSGKMKLPQGQTLDALLPNDLRQRYHAIIDTMGAPASKYDRYTPFIAGAKLVADYDKANMLYTKWLEPAVEEFSREAGVKTKSAGDVDAIPVIKEALNKPPAAGINCFAAMLQAIEYRRLHAVAAADSWAKGDIAGIKAHFSDSSMTSCVSESAGISKVGRQMVDASMASINEALATPGKTVMLISIGTLLRQGGVLDRLHAAGLTVEGPAE